MMNSKKLRTRQAAMKSRHHRTRPWDHAKRREGKRGREYIMSLFDQGLTDHEIKKLTRLSLAGVALYRIVAYLPWKERVIESRRKSLAAQQNHRKLWW